MSHYAVTGWINECKDAAQLSLTSYDRVIIANNQELIHVIW